MIRYHNIEIVYPPSQENEEIAAYLLDRLMAYRIPPAVVKKTGIRDIAEVERPTLIVLCMPESQQDPEVEEAVLRFSAAGNYSRIIALITGGRSGERFPYALLHEKLADGTVVDREPLAANISAPTLREQKRKLEVEKLRILATILGVAYDDLRNRRKRQRMRIVATAGTVVLAAALAFLGYALSRVRILSMQNEALNEQYDAASEAAEEAGEQRLEARKAFARTIASQAQNVLASGDSELALLLLLEMLPDGNGAQEIRECQAIKELPEFKETLKNSLEVLCGQGYVPLTRTASFTRPGFEAPFTSAEDEGTDLFPNDLFPDLPEGTESKEFYIKVSLQIYSKDLLGGTDDSSASGGTGDSMGATGDSEKETKDSAGGISGTDCRCGLYNGWFHDPEDNSIYCTYVHFPDAPEQDYYLRDLNGDFLELEGTLFLSDGTFVGLGKNDKRAYRVRAGNGAVLDFFDEEAEEAVKAQTADGGDDSAWTVTEGGEEDASVWTVTEAGGLHLPNPVTQFAAFEGMDLVFGFSEEAVEVFTREPFRYAGTIEGISSLRAQKGTNYLFGSRRFRLPLRIYTMQPFEYMHTLEEDQWEREVGEYVDFHVVKLSDGREMLCYGGSFYDLLTGEEIWPIKEEELVDQWTRYGQEISSEGWICLRIRDSLVIWDLADGSRKGSAPNESVFTKEFYGAYDENTGLSSAEYFCIGSTVYKYREKALVVPPDIDGQIRLAKELVGDRRLTAAERRTYHLEEE